MPHLCDDLTKDSCNNAIHHKMTQSVVEEFRTKYTEDPFVNLKWRKQIRRFNC